VKLALKALPSANTSLVILGSFVNGLVRLPGSLTKSEFDLNPYGADQRSIDRDEKTIAGKGSVDIKYDAKFGKALNNDIEISAFGTLGTFSSATREYRIINSYGLGFDANYSNTSHFLNRSNKVTVGTDMSFKPTRIEFYDNLGGERGDQLEQIISEKTSNTGVYLSDRFEIFPKKLFILFNGRYDNVVYKVNEQTVPSRSDRRPFTAYTPKVTVDYNVLRWFSLFASFNLGFESPADKELESPDPFFLFNPTLSAQKSTNYEGGFEIRDGRDERDERKEQDAHARLPLEGEVGRGLDGRDGRDERDELDERDGRGRDSREVEWNFRATIFRGHITNEIVPYEVFGDVFYRNASKTNHFGIDLESKLVLFQDLSFNVSYIFSRFIYDTYPTISMETDSTGTLAQVPRNFSGKIEPGIPEHNLKISLSYKYPLGKHVDLKGDVNYAAISKMWVDDGNTAQTKAYQVLNAFVGCEMKYGHFNILLSAGYNNILNTVYAGLITINSANFRFYNAAAPGSWAGVVNLGYNF
jgi:outer membrane receptor protein involved in Fe transport